MHYCNSCNILCRKRLCLYVPCVSSYRCVHFSRAVLLGQPRQRLFTQSWERVTYVSVANIIHKQSIICLHIYEFHVFHFQSPFIFILIRSVEKNKQVVSSQFTFSHQSRGVGLTLPSWPTLFQLLFVFLNPVGFDCAPLWWTILSALLLLSYVNR